MTTITIDDSFRITSDPRNWRVEEFTGKGAKARWEPIMYFGTLTGAVEGLVEHRMKASSSTDIPTLVEDMKTFLSGLSRHLPATITVEIMYSDSFIGESDRFLSPHKPSAEKMQIMDVAALCIDTPKESNHG